MNRRASITVCLLACLSGCTAPRPPPPADPTAAAEAFSHALQTGDATSAWSLLSAHTQSEADRLAALSRVSADAGPESGRAMLFGGAFPLGVASAHELSRDGGDALVSVFIDGGPAKTFRVIREGEGWKIDLDLAAHPAN